ncbi:hypothetical protein [Mesorhizobium sp. RMAD-H1]|uniref:hypothetical protein n=1 Tax=Mesorhizobium sp. RMAD-H1 TaxID=2587065 RepID=UPI00161FBEA8|nr:hypothetical protein [Mesorhizobium sp. RMAD-H1]MBB2974222.1 hypothetical protein [Mesorhizobium sp. RMAD-H1]
MFTSERRQYWTSIAALMVAMPTAILVHSWGSLAQWYEERPLPISVAQGASAPYSGAQWRLAQLRRLPGPYQGAAVILAEFEVRPGATPMGVSGQCRIRLTDADGRQWEPTLTIAAIARKMDPEIADRPRCGASAFAEARPGRQIKMAATFVIPTDARDLALLVEIPEAAPNALSFMWPEQ